jgi:hypothetical protein
MTTYTPSLARPYPFTLINNTFGPSSDPSVGDGSVYLTPEALMLYCQTRLQNIDSQVQADLTQQQNVDWEQQVVGDLVNQINVAQSLVGQDASNKDCLADKNAIAGLERQMEKDIAEIQARDPACPILKQLKDMHDAFMSDGSGPIAADGTKTSDQNAVLNGGSGYYNGGSSPTGMNAPDGTQKDQDYKIGSSDLQNFGDSLKQMNNTLNSSAEMKMIDIQSKVGMRTNIIQASTNIMQALDDALSKVTANIGRSG